MQSSIRVLGWASCPQNVPLFDLRSRRESVTLEELAQMGSNGGWANIADRRPQFERPPSLGVCQDCRNEPFRMTDLG